MRPIATLNELSREEFGEALRPLFEAAAPLAGALYSARPFPSYEALIDTAESMALNMPFADQANVLSAHPRIGAKPETLSAASYREQGNATEEVHAELQRLNSEYEQRFGFRFVVFVNKRPKSEILDVLKNRLGNGRDAELECGLREMFRIARDRLS